MTTITVPVLLGFDNNEIIGSLTIDKDKLPDTANFVFSLGVKCLEDIDTTGDVPRSRYMGKYELFCVSPIYDESYIGYLKQVGVL